MTIIKRLIDIGIVLEDGPDYVLSPKFVSEYESFVEKYNQNPTLTLRKLGIVHALMRIGGMTDAEMQDALSFILPFTED